MTVKELLECSLNPQHCISAFVGGELMLIHLNNVSDRVEFYCGDSPILGYEVVGFSALKDRIFITAEEAKKYDKGNII